MMGLPTANLMTVHTAASERLEAAIASGDLDKAISLAEELELISITIGAVAALQEVYPHLIESVKDDPSSKHIDRFKDILEAIDIKDMYATMH
ncbi:hypothetical protein D3C80_774500 [compost metagenome]